MSETDGYTLTRTYDAPKALVWRAISEPDLFARWYGAEIPMEVHDWDLRVGGEWHGTMTYEGTEMPWQGRFVEIDEPDRLVMHFSDATPVQEPYETFTFTLDEQGGRTELTLSQTGGNLDAEQYGQAREGTAAFLEELATVLADLG